MRLACLVTLALLAGCTSTPTQATAGDDGAHVSVEQAHPQAYVLASRPFLEALQRVTGPQRLAVARRLQADPTFTRSLKAWKTLDQDAAFDLLKHAGHLMCDELGFELPPTKLQPGALKDRAGLYDDDTDTITVQDALLKEASAYKALSTMIHEVRHAIQHQIVARDQTDDLLILAQGYKARPAAGNPDAYGDYVHLTTEFDAFQFGNAVATIVSNGKFDDTRFGTIDTHFDANGKVIFDLLNLPADADLKTRVAAANLAEAEASGRLEN